ncbi:MAG: gluconate 2-dehydrogenase subunit 3 family protein [Saprospiraceae bacterium]|nr:gluconate 2-dehydrogenase subunit 3 family protein [Saprospiraceae bacterium]
MDTYVAECYTTEYQTILQEGLVAFQAQCKSDFGKSFTQLAPLQRHNFLVQLDQTAKAATTTHYFSLLKSLVLFSYFSAESTMTQLLRYEPIPGKYIGNYPLKPNEKAWAL